MGREYSVSGFINAVLRRSSKTLLVEGPSDKSVINRLCIEHDNGSFCVVDHAGILGEDVSGLGNRERVIRVRDEAQLLSDRFPKLQNLLAVLVDREWDGLAVGEGRLRDVWIAPDQEQNSYFTLGHSVENYSFRADHVVQYLKMHFSSELTPGVLRLVGEVYVSALATAACISLSAQEAGLLRRMAGGLLTPACFHIDRGFFLLSEEASSALCRRGVDPAVAAEVVRRSNELVERHGATLAENGALRWLPHGHLGEDAIWAALVLCISSAGIDERTCNRILGSTRQERDRFFAHLLSQTNKEELHPLPNVVEWLVT